MGLLVWLGGLVTVFLHLAVPLLALRAWSQGSRPSWRLVLLVAAVLSHLGVSVGLHRYFSHGAFETSAAGKWVLATVGTLTLQGSPLYWAAQHRLHHRHCEEQHDPHSPRHGFWHAHGGFLTGLTGPSIETHPGWNLGVVRDLATDPDLEVLRGPIGVLHPALVMVGLPLAAHWGFGTHRAVWYLHLPQLLAWHATMSVNSLTHMVGYIPSQNGACGARNCPWLWLVLGGEAWHANHHLRPGAASMERAWWEVDPQFRLLELAERLGLIWNLQGGAQGPADPVPFRSLQKLASVEL